MGLVRVLEEEELWITAEEAMSRAEDRQATLELEEKLKVRRSWVSRLADSIRNVSLDDTKALWKEIAVLAGTAVVVAYLIFTDIPKKRVAGFADSREPRNPVAYNSSLFSEHRNSMRNASEATGVDAKVIEAMLYAVEQNPGYAASARAGGRRGVIPLDPVAFGIRPELLDSDPELCITAAAGLYSELRKKVGTDTEAMAALLASWEDCQKSLRTAVGCESQHHAGFGSSIDLEQELRYHESTVEMIEKHKKGELQGMDYYIALTRGARWCGGYYSGHDERYKREFEEAISAGSDDLRYKLKPRWYPGIRILSDGRLTSARRRITAFKDFTTHLPEPVGNAVRSARAYLHK